ncbi:hypothetical protein PV327_011132 [Microctonus hyperodae]|uniref:Uncharacterized protein n=1 Tax=Microctonus hyperodae TaxID=165561 RepID=A0AA39C5Z4_MICHY|nr:hypothetical protein PV327_011132 [Microctonus hyperodae]
MHYESLKPITTILPHAQEELLNTIFCNCKSGCGQCNGQACLNASPYQSDINEDGIFDFEIMEGLETNVVEDENEDESEILQQPKDEEEEEDDEN